MYNKDEIKHKKEGIIISGQELKKGFMFKVCGSKDKKYEDLMKIRSSSVLRNKYFEEWNKQELLQLIELYYEYFNKNKKFDLVWDISEYVVSGQYSKDRNE